MDTKVNPEMVNIIANTYAKSFGLDISKVEEETGNDLKYELGDIGGEVIGEIDIPKDLFLKSAEIVTDPEDTQLENI